MLINMTKTQNFNATSAVKVKGVETPVMYMYGAVNAEGLPSQNTNIANYDLYIANKEAVDADFQEFWAEVCEAAGSGS